MFNISQNPRTPNPDTTVVHIGPYLPSNIIIDPDSQTARKIYSDKIYKNMYNSIMYSAILLYIIYYVYRIVTGGIFHRCVYAIPFHSIPYNTGPAI